MGEGSKRNKPCWCGSGKKLKHCHLDREKEERLKLWEAEQELRKPFNKKLCLVPESWRVHCSRHIVKAHTVPKSGSLKRIAREGRVYGIVPNLMSIDRGSGRVSPELIGVNRASTFTGFCAKHDDSLFAPLEKRAFAFEPEQCFLLAYRALSRERYAKEASASLHSLRQQADRGRSTEDQVAIQSVASWMQEGLEAGVRDLGFYSAIYDRMLIESSFSEIRAYVVELGDGPTIMCSGGFFPEQDFDGNPLQDITILEQTPHMLSVSSFFGGNNGIAAFVWTPESDATCRRFVETLDRISDEKLSSAIARLLFEHLENIYLQPDWWEGLSTPIRDSLIDRIHSGASTERKVSALKDDGMLSAEWRVLRRVWLPPRNANP